MKKQGTQTYLLENPVNITSTACIVGPKEKAGPLHKYFDKTLDDEFWGEKSWEKAESKIIKETVNMAIAKSGIATNNIDFCFAGDLLNQCISSSFGLRETNIPFFRSIWCLLYFRRKCYSCIYGNRWWFCYKLLMC